MSVCSRTRGAAARLQQRPGPLSCTGAGAQRRRWSGAAPRTRTDTRRIQRLRTGPSGPERSQDRQRTDPGPAGSYLLIEAADHGLDPLHGLVRRHVRAEQRQRRLKQSEAAERALMSA